MASDRLSGLPAFLVPPAIRTTIVTSSFTPYTWQPRPHSAAALTPRASLQPPPPAAAAKASSVVKATSSPKAASAAKAAAATAAATAAALVLCAHPSPTTLSAHFPLFVPPAHAARGGGAGLQSSSGAVIKDPESLLRWSLPITNPAIRELQTELEAAVNDLRGLKWQKVDGHVKSAVRVLNNQDAKILADIPSDRVADAKALLASITERIPAVEAALGEKSGDKFTVACKEALRDVGRVEELMVKSFPFKVPEEFSKLPQLKGRATVEVVVRKADGDAFDINGTLYPEGNMTMVVDGYSAPLSAGSFIDLVSRGFYNDIDVIRSDGFIVQTGKPKDGEGFMLDNGEMRTIPLEVFAKEDPMPTYGETLEEDGRGSAATVLPFTSYGTLAMARAEFEPNTASSQFFWFLFEPDLTPAGRNLMDGNWAVFGYTTKGESFLKGLQKGDRIVSIKVVDGLENLVT